MRQALDTVGAIAGPLLAVGAMALFAGDFRAAFWVAVVPAALCVALIVFGVREPVHRDEGKPPPRLTFADVRRLDRRFAFVTAIAAILTLARFSEAFLVLRAQDVGMPLAQAPWVMVAMAIVYALLASSRRRVRRPRSFGLADRRRDDRLSLLISCRSRKRCICSPDRRRAVGLHLALTQSLLSALVAAVAPPDLRGTAFGVFNLVSGVALLVASGLAGLLWDLAGPAWTFYAGAAFTLVAWIGMPLPSQPARALVARTASTTGSARRTSRTTRPRAPPMRSPPLANSRRDPAPA